MAFLLFLPLIVFGLVALLALAIQIRIEITERQRRPRKSIRRTFRPTVIEGGKPQIAPAGDQNPASVPLKLVV